MDEVSAYARVDVERDNRLREHANYEVFHAYYTSRDNALPKEEDAHYKAQEAHRKALLASVRATEALVGTEYESFAMSALDALFDRRASWMDIKWLQDNADSIADGWEIDEEGNNCVYYDQHGSHMIGRRYYEQAAHPIEYDVFEFFLTINDGGEAPREFALALTQDYETCPGTRSRKVITVPEMLRAIRHMISFSGSMYGEPGTLAAARAIAGAELQLAIDSFVRVYGLDPINEWEADRGMDCVPPTPYAARFGE